MSLSPLTVFFDADPVIKLVMLLLTAASLAAVVVSLLKLLSRRRLAGGSAFLSSLRLGGPLVGLLGATYVGLMMFLGIAAAERGSIDLQVLSPGLAEVVLLLLLGFLAGTVAVIANWAVEARIDRTVLKP